MTRTIKTVLRVITAFLLLVFLLESPAAASSVKVRCYTISSGKTTVYGNSSLTKKSGTITGSVEIKVLSVSRKHCKISFTGNDGERRTGYISTKAILCGTDGKSCEVRDKLKACRRPGGKSWGSVPAGTRVKILGSCGKYTQVRYTRSGSTRFAFVKTKNLKDAIK